MAQDTGTFRTAGSQESNHFEQQPIAPAFLAPSVKEAEAPADPVSHSSALERNALHRQQLAEVVARHQERTGQVAKEQGRTEEEEQVEEERTPQHVTEGLPRAVKVTDFLAKKTGDRKTGDRKTGDGKTDDGKTADRKTSLKTSTKKSDSGSGTNRIKSDFPRHLVEHLELLSELDSQVEDLFSLAMVIFSETPRKRKGGEEGPRRREGGEEEPGRRPLGADPRRVQLEEE